jgi:hypothetical protein
VATRQFPVVFELRAQLKVKGSTPLSIAAKFF